MRTEGIDVVADLPIHEDAVAEAGRLHPEVVIVDVTPEDERALVLARQLRQLPQPPTVVLTSSIPLATFDTKLDSLPFIAKDDLRCSEVLTAIAIARRQTRFWAMTAAAITGTTLSLRAARRIAEAPLVTRLSRPPGIAAV